MKGEGQPWEIVSHAMTSSQGEKVLFSCCNSQTLRWSASTLPNNKLYCCFLSNVTVLIMLLDKILREGPRDYSSGTTLCVSTYHVTLPCTWQNLPGFSLCFCILQAIKNWRQEQPENKAAIDLVLYPGSTLSGGVWEWDYSWSGLKDCFMHAFQ